MRPVTGSAWRVCRRQRQRSKTPSQICRVRGAQSGFFSLCASLIYLASEAILIFLTASIAAFDTPRLYSPCKLRSVPRVPVPALRQSLLLEESNEGLVQDRDVSRSSSRSRWACCPARYPRFRQQAPLALTTFGTAYTQDFNTSGQQRDRQQRCSGRLGVQRESGTNANTTYRAGTGSDNTGDTYSFGASGNSERAFGGLRSGSLVPLIGAQFTNNTGGTITSLEISYTGEQWRLGQNTTGRAADRLDFQLSSNATSLTTGTWTDYDSLDFSSPVVAGTVGALNGNVSPNRTTVSFTITGLTHREWCVVLAPLGGHGPDPGRRRWAFSR